MVDLVKAKELRESGKTYDEISKELDCSLAWCKLYLKGVTKNIMEVDAMDKLLVKAKSNTGITSGEISYALCKVKPHERTKEETEAHEKSVRRVKTKIKAQDGTLIRPYWVVPEQAEAIYHSMLRKLQAKDERDQEDIDNLMEEFGLDESYVTSLKFALYSLSTIGSSILKHSVVDEINRIGEVVEELESRNAEVKPKEIKQTGKSKHVWPDFSDIESYIY